MTASPNVAADAHAGSEAGGTAAPAAGAAPFVLNLCSSTTPMALAQVELPELKRFDFFVSRRFEEGRERFRLHMGYFATLAEAEEWLGVVREIYPGAWAGEAPGRKLRERAAAANAAQAQHAAGPQPAVSVAARVPVTAPAPAAAPRAATSPVTQRVPIVHAAPPVARAAPVLAPAMTAPPPAAAVPVARPAPRVPALAPTMPAPKASAPAATARAAAAAPKVAVAAPRAASAAAAPKAAAPKAAARAAGGTPGKAARVRQVFEDSNVREVLAALGDASATGETRLMRAPPPPREVAAENPALTDTQVLKFLESRRSEGSEPAPVGIDDSAIPLLKPDDTGTRQALKDAVASNAAVAFAVQLQWSVWPVELEKLPPLAIFSAYTLYTVEGSRDGRKWYGVRLGFFSDAISAKQVAYYVRSEFSSVAVVPVSPEEKTRATAQETAAMLATPVPTRSDPMDEFKLIDDAAGKPVLPVPVVAAAKPLPGRGVPRLAVGRSLTQPQQAQQAAQAPPARQRVRGRPGARENRGPATLEETLEILGASQLQIDTGSNETLNESGVRHLRVEVQKNSPFSKLLGRLSERLKKN